MGVIALEMKFNQMREQTPVVRVTESLTKESKLPFIGSVRSVTATILFLCGCL